MATSCNKTSVQRILITNHCLTRLKKVAGESLSTLLIGKVSDSTACIEGFHVLRSGDKIDEIAHQCVSLLPGGCGIIGFSHCSTNPGEKSSLEKFLLKIFESSSYLEDVIGCWTFNGIGDTSEHDRSLTNGCIALSLSSSASNDVIGYMYNIEGRSLANVNLDIDPDNVKITGSSGREGLLFRVRGEIEVGFSHQDKKELRKESLEAELSRLRRSLQSDHTSVFRLSDTDVLLYDRPSRDWPKGSLSGDSAALRLVSLADDKRSGDTSANKKSDKKLTSQTQALDIELMKQMTGGRFGDGNTVLTCAPVIHHTHDSYRYVKLMLPIDVLVRASHNTKLSQLVHMFTSAISTQLYAMGENILQYYNKDVYDIPQAFHVHPDDLEHTVTVIYPHSVDDQLLDKERKKLHESLSLPLTQPMFRRANALTLSVSGSSCPNLLSNVHVGLSPSGVTGGVVHMIRGRYDYHHYMQDRLNDDGWGCAYRSLQTVVSWLRLQGYISQAPPSHNQIQQALVDVGDKDKSFVGSKKWIGSNELSYVLDHLYQVSSKILHVSSGAEMAYKARDLAHHFDTQHSPVMIGGGVLAHTILGVDWNEDSGEVKFLILDPHYTGAEDLKTIQDKGWCGWKGPEFWNQTAYYNMCMPQRPIVY